MLPFSLLSAFPSRPHRRALHAASLLLARKPIGSQLPSTSSGHPDFDQLVKDMDPSLWTPYRNDGMSAYQIKLVTEAVLVRSYLEKVQSELPLLPNLLNPIPFSPPAKSAYLRFRFVDHPSDPSNPMRNKVTLFVKLSDVIAQENLSTAHTHSLKLLAGPRFNPITNTITLANDRFPYRAQNKRWLVDTFANLVRQAKETTIDFTNVPMDTRHVAKKMKSLERQQRFRFPKHWLVKPAASSVSATTTPNVQGVTISNHSLDSSDSSSQPSPTLIDQPAPVTSISTPIS